ncbi:MAG: hypothetical protein A2583_16405 [Bdellovibrionales bacterium RIFOXYD1_FULL_53_11]|nr:MAG: hypothetical protein A2583_16405 [Bdellovibrionales bacterium RIFOXYD1_FULL_53_11]
MIRLLGYALLVLLAPFAPPPAAYAEVACNPEIQDVLWAKHTPTQLQDRIFELQNTGRYEIAAHYQKKLEERMRSFNGRVIDDTNSKALMGSTKPRLVHLGDGVKAVFKPHNPSMVASNHLHEVAAYELDKLLGIGKVPVTVEAKFMVNGVETTGSLQIFVKGKVLNKLPASRIATVKTSVQHHEMQFFDWLTFNWDRHGENVIVGARDNIHAIDHGFSFMGNKGYLSGYDPVFSIPSARILSKLSSVSNDAIRTVLKGRVDNDVIGWILKRKEWVLGHFEIKNGRVAVKNGYDNYAALLKTAPEPPVLSAHRETIRKLREAQTGEGSTAVQRPVASGSGGETQPTVDRNAKTLPRRRLAP